MNILFAAVALATAQAAQPAPVDHSQHNAAQHAQHHDGQKGHHDGDHKCCSEVNGKMECQMMKGHGAPERQQGEHQGHGSGH
jgi:uncharacterized protein involved in copper resistance